MMSKRTPSDVIEELLHQMGYKGTYMGMASLATAVELVWQDRTLLHAVTKVLYPEVARRCGGTWRTVERNLRTAAKACWDHGDRALIQEMAGIELRDMPSTGELIYYIVAYIRRHGLLDEFEAD